MKQWVVRHSWEMNLCAKKNYYTCNGHSWDCTRYTIGRAIHSDMQGDYKCCQTITFFFYHNIYILRIYDINTSSQVDSLSFYGPCWHPSPDGVLVSIANECTVKVEQSIRPGKLCWPIFTLLLFARWLEYYSVWFLACNFIHSFYKYLPRPTQLKGTIPKERCHWRTGCSNNVA